MSKQREGTGRNALTCGCTVIHDDILDRIRPEMLDEPVFERSAHFFKIMGNLTRFRILWALDQHELCVCDLAHLLGMTKSAISHQLAVLRAANLVHFRRAGKVVYYAIADDHVHLMLAGCVSHATE